MEDTHKPLFISYRSTDRALAQHLYDRLTAAGFDVWFDVEELDRVTQWHGLIEEACEAARIVLPVLTPNWQSEWTEYETYGAEHAVPLVFAGEGEMHECVPAPIREWQALDLRQATDETWQTLFKWLKGALEHLLPHDKRPRAHHLPIGVNPCFVGRERALLELNRQLCQTPATVLTHGPAFVVEGMGGIGKTTLARHYAEKFWRLYRDLLWVSAANPELLPLEFARQAETLGVAMGDDVDVNARRALEELTRGPRRLLIIDNAHDEDSIQDWLPKSGKCRTIITSRFTGWSAEVQAMHVHVLEREPAQELLCRRSGLPDTEANRTAADELAEELGYLPLALEQAAAYIHQQHGTLQRYLEQYAQHRDRLLARRQPGGARYPDSVATTWQISVAKLGPEALDLLRLLAFVAPDPLPRDVLRQAGDLLGGLDEFAVDEALMELHRYSLIELGDEDGPLTIHRLLQAVQEDGLEVGERQGWVEQALRVVGGVFPTADHDSWELCEVLVPHALAVTAHADARDMLAHETGLVPLRLATFFQFRGRMSASATPAAQAVNMYERLCAEDRGNSEWQHELSLALLSLGIVRKAQGSLGEALHAYEAALSISQRLVATDPNNAAWAFDLSVTHERLGDVLTEQLDLSRARGAHEAALAVRQRLAQADPENAKWQAETTVSLNRLGGISLQQGSLGEALQAYEAALSIRERLVAADQTNPQWQSDVTGSYERLGNVRVAQGNLMGALADYEACHAIRERLAAADPGNAAWQRDLSISHEKLGDVRRAQANLTGALEACQDSLAIRERLTAADPGNAEWQRDLSISHQKLGDVRRVQGNLSGALAAYQDGLDIAQRLAAADPGNAQWQRDLSVSHHRIGGVRMAQGDLTGALEAYETALRIAERLVATDPGNAAWQLILSASLDGIGDVRGAQGDLPGARREREAALTITARLADGDPHNATWQRYLAVSFYKLAAFHNEAGQQEQAMTRLRECREVLRGMRARGMHLDPPIAGLLEQLEGLP